MYLNGEYRIRTQAWREQEQDVNTKTDSCNTVCGATPRNPTHSSTALFLVKEVWWKNCIRPSANSSHFQRNHERLNMFGYKKSALFIVMSYSTST